MATSVRRFFWQPFNQTYGPWFRMLEVKDGISHPLSSSGRGAEAIVMPDMDGAHWYWSVRFAKYNPKLEMEKSDQFTTKEGKKRATTKKKVPLPEIKRGGKAATREEAMRLAEESFVMGRNG